MNDLAYSILWCIAQITLLALVASAIYAIVGRVVPRIRGSVALTSLVCIIPLSALALSSWPRWSLPELPRLEFSVTAPAAKDLPVETAAVLISEPIRIDDHDTSADESRKFTYRDIEVGSATIPQNRSDSHATSADLPPALKFVETQDRAERSHINNVTVIDQPALESPIATDDAATASPTSESNISSAWPIAILLLFSLSLAIGLIRLGAGVRFVRAQRRNATVVEDPELLELVDILCSNVGGTRWVDVRESAQISTAATIGWRRPIILLPVEWPTWSSAERRAVLAHEIAHIKNRDFIAWLCAQLGLSLHYYHPLVHWLVSRLRLEQELAADALAAPLAGGPTSYLQTLAAMALRQSEQPLSWPARAFLPTRDTLLRRIEMLKRPQTFSKSLFSRPVRYAAVALIIGAGAVAAGLRAGNDATETPQRSQTIILTGTDPQNIQNVPLDGFTSPRMFASEPQLAESTAATPQAEPPLPSEAPSYQPESDSDKEYVAKSKENLVKIAAAMRKYRAVYRAYPSAVAMGPKKHPYSWRVALLPFFDGKEGLELSEQYNFEEPWDGPTNKKLLGKMPDVYRSPLDNADRRTMSEDARLAASYYMLLGPLFQSTALPADEAGMQLQNLQKWYWNGTVNDASRDRTAAMRAWSPLIIEAKRSTPWTKPSDVLFDPEGPIEQLNGWHADALPVLDAQLKTSFLARSEGSEKTVSALRQLSKSTYAATAATAPTMAPTVVVAREKVGLERAVAGMSVVYFQGKARRVVSGLVLDAGDETLFVTTSPATLHPEGLPPAIDRLELVAGWLRDDRVEFAHSQDSTNELYIARAKQRLSDFKLEQVASVSAGDHLDAAYFDSEKKLTIRGKAAKVIQPGGTVLQLALNPETIRTYRDVQQIEGRYPEGTVLLKQGKLAGLVLAGERFVRNEDNHSFFVPAERIVERYKEIRERDAVTRNTQRADRSGSLVGSEQADDDADLSTTFRGLIVLQGTPPNLPPLIRKGSKGRMGMEFTQDIPDERLRIGMPVDIENAVVHGLANVFVYLKVAPNNTPAPVDLTSPETEILDGVFKPHALLLRTGQPVR
ncbi:MAG: M56 family metallopeptidase, partial [Planctomycetaceae bacterium]